MQRRIHMMDQVGTNKVEEIKTHFDRCTLRMWVGNFEWLPWVFKTTIPNVSNSIYIKAPQ